MSLSCAAIPKTRIGITSLRGLRSPGARTKAEGFAYNSTNISPPALSAAESTSEVIQSKDRGEMASDEDYAAFLDKANEDPSKGVVSTQSSGKIQLKAVDHGVRVPAALKAATSDAFYVSDADEPFEPVVLKGAGKSLPDEGMLLSSFLRVVFGKDRSTGLWRGVC